MEDLKKLDQISPTLFCTGQIFYLKRNQTQLSESFGNMVRLFVRREKEMTIELRLEQSGTVESGLSDNDSEVRLGGGNPTALRLDRQCRNELETGLG